jgi:hypothetical protein
MASRSLDGETARPPGLERRPEARALSIEDLMRQVLDGRLRVPQFQRAFKWTVHDAIKLLDSIYQGYPVGTLLLWQQPGEAETLRYGSVEIGAQAMTDALWVVDGQQRIHSLTRVLLGKGLGADTFTLHFDLRDERFVRLVRASQVSAHHVPMTEVLDSERLLRWLLKAGPEIDQTRAIRLGKRIREYQLPVYIVRTPEEDAVREIYRRVNSTGHNMQDSEVFDAIHGARSGRRPSGLRGIAESMRSLGFGELEGDLLLKMMRAMLGRDVFEQGVPGLSTADSPERLAALERAARAAIEFLRQDVGVPHHSLLPYDLPLIVLTAFFQHFPTIHPRSRELLSRWVWRGALTAAHQNNPLQMAPALAAIVPGAEHETIQRLLASVPRGPGDTLEYHPFALNWARCRIQLLAQLHLGPRHLVTGAPVAFETNITEVTRNLLPDASAPWQSHLANRIIHPTLRRGFRAALLGVQDPALLATHLISPHALQRLRDGDDDGFFAARAADQSAHISAFVAHRARWDQSDRPPLEALVVGEDD